VKVTEQKNAVFCSVHAAFGGEPDVRPAAKYAVLNMHFEALQRTGVTFGNSIALFKGCFPKDRTAKNVVFAVLTAVPPPRCLAGQPVMMNMERKRQ